MHSAADVKLFSGVQIRRRGDWVTAAMAFLQRQGVIDGLFKQYDALKNLATDYATRVQSNSWRKDQGSIGAEVSHLASQCII